MNTAINKSNELNRGTIHQGVISFDLNGQVLYFSPTVKKTLQHLLNVTVSIGDKLETWKIPSLKEEFIKAVNGGESIFSICDTLVAGILVDVHLFRIEEQGKAVSVLMVASERMSSANEIQEELRKLSFVAINTHNAVMICDKNGDIEWVNKGFVNLTGFTEEEVMGKDPIDLLYDSRSDLATKEKIQLQLYERRQVIETFLNYNKRGEPYWIQLIVSPVVDAEKNLLYYVAVGADITDKMNYLNEVESRNRLFDSISKSIPAVVYVFNLEESRLDFINDYVFTLTGFTAEEMMRTNRKMRASIIDPSDYSIFKSSLLKLTTENASTEESCQLTITHKSGERRVITLTHIVFQRNSISKPTHILGSVIDITEKHKTDKYKESVAKLQELQYRKNQKLRSLTLLQGQEEERKRLARELHDGIGQLLTATRLKLNAMEDVPPAEPKFQLLFSDVKDLVLKTIQEVRAVSYALVPIDLFDFGLDAAVMQLCETAKKSGLPALFQSNLKGKRLNSTIEIELYRIAQEAINNCIKYSKAKSLDVQLSVNNSAGHIKLMIIDDGVGFNPDQNYIYKKNTSRSFGLRNMHERTRIINGKLSIISEEGEGCVIIVEAPLKLVDL
jgi:PAS domain S-box-containing protein